MASKTKRGKSSERGGDANKNRFEELPNEIRYKIVAFLNAKSLASAKCVCKEWNQSLGEKSLKTLTLHCNSSNSSVFLVRISHYNDTRDSFFVTVDQRGRCSPLDMLNKNPYLLRDWDVSCNGMLASFPLSGGMRASFPPYYDGNSKAILCHPSLRWFKAIPLNLTLTHAKSFSYVYVLLYGAFFDPTTWHFTLLICFSHDRPARRGPYFYEVHIYSSESGGWTTVVHETRPKDRIEVKVVNGVFSQGCFFWIHRDCSRAQKFYKGIVAFNLSGRRFNTMPLPQCPLLLANQGMSCHRPLLRGSGHEWELKGCDGNLVLAHYVVDRLNRSTETEAFVWRSEQSEIPLKWNLVLHLPHLSIPYVLRFESDKRGWSLWAQSTWRSIKYQRDLLMLNEHGDVQQLIPVADLVSFLGIQSDSRALIKGVWTLKTNNLWDILAFS